MSIKFSIIVPVYNCENTIKVCFNSLIKQNFDNYEIIFVNDGSTDKSLDVLNTLAKKGNKFKVFDRPHIGACAARNYGLKQAKGDFIVYVDSDDEVSVDLLNSLNTINTKYVNLDMIVYRYAKEDESNVAYGFDVEPGFYNKQDIANKIIDPHFMKGMINNKIILNSCNVCYSRVYLLNHYCQDETIVYGEDWAYSYECLYFADNIFLLDKSLYLYKNTNVQSVTHAKRDVIEKLNDFCKLMFYIGDRFAFEEDQINKRFAKCCLYGISINLNQAWGSKLLDFPKMAKNLNSSDKILTCKLIKATNSLLERNIDKLYSKYLEKLFS